VMPTNDVNRLMTIEALATSGSHAQARSATSPKLLESDTSFVRSSLLRNSEANAPPRASHTPSDEGEVGDAGVLCESLPEATRASTLMCSTYG
jgi:hypothetical protein